MSFTIFKPIQKAERSCFIPVRRDHKNSDYNSNQQQKRNNADKKEKEMSPVKSVRKDKETGDLIVKYENGVEKRYTKDNPNRSLAEENLHYQNYGISFDFKA